ncbi:class I SAM-dependent methyltransferase [Actinoplanes sp. NPDC049265]|uniref:class I SAM-dependent methyltransferase n=1 Tax=Actinoplanes sp. NPDC049265 TaxID=3363902 RepID=UPI003717A91E
MSLITDYDSNGYDYRSYWDDRDYEAWAEDHALENTVPWLGSPEWMVDFGGGFGRNAKHYRTRARRYVLVDYSTTNLRNAAQGLAGDVADGRAYLIRADLNRLPFVDHAFDAAMVVRVLHHLSDVEGALAEMGRTVRDRWLLDIPIKHHVLGLARAAVHGDLAAMRGPEPVVTGHSETPFYNFKLSVVRQRLLDAGWNTRLAGSVNNLRRWDRSLPPAMVRTLRPAVQAVETAVRHGGRGWFGPSQFVYANRNTNELALRATDSLAARMCCPACGGWLDWTPDAATCESCWSAYPCSDGFWDFTVRAA